MKKILFITPYVPSKRAGGENYTRLLLENLSLKNKIDLLYFRYVDDPKYDIPNDNICVIKEVVNSTSLKIKNFLKYPFVHPLFSIRFDRRILEFLKHKMQKEKYDLLFLDHSQMALYGKFFPQVHKVFMSHDVMAQRFSRQGNNFMRKLIVKSEGMVMHLPNTTVFTFSEKDRHLIKETYGIDSFATSFYLDEMVMDAFPQKISKRVVFMGKWSRADNFDGLKWFFDSVYDKLDKDFSISIIGKWLPESFVKRIKELSNVEYLGFVNNPYQLIADSWVTASPLFSGAGVKVKVVESLACGTPVVGNNIAFEGISKEFSAFMIDASSADEFAKKINNLNVSLEERQKFKDRFISSYQKMLLSNYINEM